MNDGFARMPTNRHRPAGAQFAPPMDAQIVSCGADIALHPRSPDDAREMWALVDAHRADLRTWLPWVDATKSLADARRYARYAEVAFERAHAFDYGVRVAGTLGGTVGTHPIDWANRSASIGYWLAPAFRGRGVMTRAVSTLVERCIEHFRLHRIEIECVVENEKSRAIAQRLDFVLEGTLAEAYYLHDRYRDIALYATTAARWNARHEDIA
jgi:ribosomal-protein-serine acetyltransferase